MTLRALHCFLSLLETVALRFLLNQSLVEEPELPPDLTILEYLRKHRALTGTKEGCASGDCGACTVVVSEVGDGRVQYKSVNSCIALAGDLHGRQLITVEHLSEKEKLHCSQQAMVDCHASQCGFCTPGFVMSVFALTKHKVPASESKRQFVERFLGGNLCRCTGYRPIADAACQALGIAENSADQFDRGEAETVAQLDAISAELSSNGFHRPQHLNELFALKALYPEAPLVSGCTDFGLEITQRLKSYTNVISTSRLAELNYIHVGDGVWRVGAGCTIETLRRTLGPLHRGIGELLLRYGSTQVRNLATVGGNIGNASPIGDLPPLFIALDAEIVLQSATGKRTLPLQSFFLDYKKTDLHVDEIIAEVRFRNDRLDGQGEFQVYKISKRIDDDISTVCAAFHWMPDEKSSGVLTAAFGGMAAIPARARSLEQVVTTIASGALGMKAALDALENDFNPIDDARASADYRMTVAKNLFKKFVLEYHGSAATGALKLSDVLHD